MRSAPQRRIPPALSINLPPNAAKIILAAIIVLEDARGKFAEVSSASITVRRADLQEILDLRWKVLRDGLPRETAIFDGDQEPTTHHFAAIHDNRIIGCVTIMHRLWQNRPAWQLRGMAIDPQFQRTGIGGQLLQQVEQTIRSHPHSRQLWCNARTPATAFYRKFGWQLIGDEFLIPTAGPHYKMCKLLD
jgi:GNAT superfamily N-acetyltransferase